MYLNVAAVTGWSEGGENRRPGLILNYLFHMTMHYHAQFLAKRMASKELQLVNSF